MNSNHKRNYTAAPSSSSSTSCDEETHNASANVVNVEN